MCDGHYDVINDSDDGLLLMVAMVIVMIIIDTVVCQQHVMQVEERNSARSFPFTSFY